jgi:hypothetical protein
MPNRRAMFPKKTTSWAIAAPASPEGDAGLTGATSVGRRSEKEMS